VVGSMSVVAVVSGCSVGAGAPHPPAVRPNAAKDKTEQAKDERQGARRFIRAIGKSMPLA